MLNRTLLASGLVVASLLAVPASAGNWNGFYVGLHAGGATGDIDWTNVSNPIGSLNFTPGQTISQGPEGVLGGAQLGYNFQMSDWVFGLEAEWSGLDFDATDQNPNAGDTEVMNSELNWLATGTARLGYSTMDSLLYLKGGYATGGIQTSHIDPGSNAYSTDETHQGWIAGAGIEHQIGDHVSVGLEYNYIDLGEQDHSGAATGGTVVNNIESTLHTVTARLNYNFYTP